MTIENGAVFELSDGVCDMRFERHFAHPVERVWAALTEPDQLKSWFAEFQGSIAPGSNVKLTWTGGETRDSTVTEFDPPRVFAWTWNKESTVRWELTPEPSGTLFVLTHNLPNASTDELTNTLGGWQEHLAVLADQLNGAPRAWSAERWRDFKNQYAALIDARQVARA